MNWNSIGSGIGSLWDAAKGAAESVEQSAARGAIAVVDSVPVQNLPPGITDPVDQFLQAHAGYDFPKTLDVPAPAGHVSLPPGQPASVISPAGLTLTGSQPTASFGIHLDQSGDARLDLQASGPGTDWGKAGAESAVMSVYVDGKYQQDVVLFGGADKTPYGLSLGNLPAGDHTITLRYAQEKSTAGATGIQVSSGTATQVQYATAEDCWVAQNAPVLIGRHGVENNQNDTPLGMWHHVQQNPDGTRTITYGYVFSNEDTGDGGQPALEQARWGRLTDIDQEFRVKLDANGQPLSRELVGSGDNWQPFAGRFDGTHPIVRVATDNNNVSDQGDGPLRFQFPTDNPIGDFPTDELMHRHPEWFAVEGKELQREGKIDPSGVGDPPKPDFFGTLQSIFGGTGLPQLTMADPRNYLYVQLDARGADKDPIVARVTLKNGQTIDSDLGVEDAAIQRDGWAQTTVRLPPGTTQADIASVMFVSAHGTSHVARVGSTYLLDSDYKPIDLPPTLVTPS